jgi:nucleoside-diphosphate-sugar epimerase
VTGGLRDAAVLVTGGAGFVVGALVRRLLADGAGRIVIVDNLLSADIGNVPEHPRV